MPNAPAAFREHAITVARLRRANADVPFVRGLPSALHVRRRAGAACICVNATAGACAHD